MANRDKTALSWESKGREKIIDAIRMKVMALWESNAMISYKTKSLIEKPNIQNMSISMIFNENQNQCLKNIFFVHNIDHVFCHECVGIQCKKSIKL